MKKDVSVQWVDTAVNQRRDRYGIASGMFLGFGLSVPG
jgi:hypothetical protein